MIDESQSKRLKFFKNLSIAVNFCLYTLPIISVKSRLSKVANIVSSMVIIVADLGEWLIKASSPKLAPADKLLTWVSVLSSIHLVTSEPSNGVGVLFNLN